MKVLVGAPPRRADDLCAGVAGEVVYSTVMCGCGDRSCPRTAWTGVATGCGFTRATVTDLDITHAQLVAMVDESLRAAGWLAEAEVVEGCVCEIEGWAEAYEVGTVLRRCVDEDGDDDVEPE